jgi:hypothetical protein
MKRLPWFDRQFPSNLPIGMFPFYLERLEGTVARLEAKLKNVSEQILSTRFEDKWSVKQNIGHLAEVDEISYKRIDEIINGISPMSPAVFEPKLDYNSMPVNKVLEYFRKNRTRNVERYRNIAEEHLKKSSLHPRLKVMMTPVDLSFFEAEHDDHHLVTISTILKR